ncbi:MAG TPA: fibronectin type III domain-containing protein [Candidatus Dormibacteraeota bacterium]|nr:fibronectin type III domain-containing protein [Candidatus Dormibacteraeota bacterium]
MKQKHPILRLFVLTMLLVVGLLAWNVSSSTGRASAAATPVSCSPSGTTYGTDSFSVSNSPPNPLVFTASSTLTYQIWVRIQMPTASTSPPLLMNLDNATGTNCYNVDGSSVTANTWTWVSVAQLQLAPGNHALLLTGLQNGVSVDSIEALSDTNCNPNTTDCTSATNNPPTISMTAPANAATVSGTVALSATATAATGLTVSTVQFQVDGSNVGSADTTSPYGFSWNTTGVSNGSHTLTAIVTDSSGNSTTAGQITVTVNNTVTPTCTSGRTLSVPTSLTKTGSTYTTVSFGWTAPAPTTGCSITRYNILRNGSQVGTSTTTSYTDTGLTAGATNNYTVQAVDSGPNTSAASAALSAGTSADNVAPNMPTGLGATAASASTINLSWTASTDNPSPGGVGVRGYNIYRCSGAGCTPNISGTPLNGNTLVVATTYSDTTGSPSTQYTYVVTAVDNASPGNEGSPSSGATATTQNSPPSCTGNPTTPGIPAKTGSTVTSVSFNWAASSASAGCTLQGYHIYRSDVSATTPIATVTSGTSYTNTGLTPNTSYTYTVKAFDTASHNSSGATNSSLIATLPDTNAPTAPGSVTATAISGVQVSLTWPAATDNVGVASYKIYRSDKPTIALATVTATAASSYSYTDSSTVLPSTSYSYQVSAFDGAGNQSPKTSSNTVQTPAASGTPPSAPRTPSVGPVASQGAALVWTAPASGTVIGYHVYIGNNTTQVLDTSVTDSSSFTSTGGTLGCLASNVSYTVIVKAFNAGGEGPAVTIPVSTPSGALSADFDCSGHVNSTDLSILARPGSWSHNGLLPTDGDANGDTFDNSVDLSKLATNWGK